MSEAKHTPGPWEVVVPADGLWPPRVFSGSKFIGMVNNSDDTQEQRVADARLIAAAPDLLEALEPFDDAARDRAADASEWKDGDTVAVWVTIGDLRKARAAIARAKGETT